MTPSDELMVFVAILKAVGKEASIDPLKLFGLAAAESLLFHGSSPLGPLNHSSERPGGLIIAERNDWILICDAFPSSRVSVSKWGATLAHDHKKKRAISQLF